MRVSCGMLRQRRSSSPRSGGGGEPESESVDCLVTQLEGMGARVYLNDDDVDDGELIKSAGVKGGDVGRQPGPRTLDEHGGTLLWRE